MCSLIYMLFLLINIISWTFRKKWMATVIVSFFTFISPVSSSMVAPATSQIVDEFGITNSVIQAMVTSVFILGYGESGLPIKDQLLILPQAFGPLVCKSPHHMRPFFESFQFLGPMSELWGRSRVLQLSNLFYLGQFNYQIYI